ncbi:MAG: hypothetical protein AB7G93_16825 [Bdellovibrionales bacterium]
MIMNISNRNSISRLVSLFALTVLAQMPTHADSQEMIYEVEPNSYPFEVMIDPILFVEPGVEPSITPFNAPLDVPVVLDPSVVGGEGNLIENLTPSSVELQYNESVSESGSSAISGSLSAFVSHGSDAEYVIKSMSAALINSASVEIRSYLRMPTNTVLDVSIEVVNSEGVVVSGVYLDDQAFIGGANTLISEILSLAEAPLGEYGARIVIYSQDGRHLLFEDKPRVFFSLM